MENGAEFLKKLNEAHNGRWKSFFKIYNPKSSYKKSYTLKLSVLISTGLQILLLYSGSDLFKIFEGLISRNLSIIPNILGFTIGAYALLISGSSEKIIKKIAKTQLKKEKLPYNSFQKTSAVFGMAIFVMSTCLIFNYISQIVIDSKFFYTIEVPARQAIIINSILMIVVNTISIYALLLIFNTIINLFAFSQFISAIITIEKKEEDITD